MHIRYTGGKQRSCFIRWCQYLKTAKAAVIDRFVHAPFFNGLYLKNRHWLFGDLLSGPVLYYIMQVLAADADLHQSWTLVVTNTNRLIHFRGAMVQILLMFLQQVPRPDQALKRVIVHTT